MSFWRERWGGALAAAIGVVVVAFVADTVTTAAAGAARAGDLNPLVRSLSPSAYVAFSIARGLVAVAIVIAFWPRRLEPRWRRRLARLVLPFSHRGVAGYFGAQLVLAAAGIKVATAASNALAFGFESLAHPAAVVGLGLGVGLGVGNLLLELRSRELERNQRSMRSP